MLLNYNKKKSDASSVSRNTLAPNLSFAASEAYKRLRTNLTFSFAGDEQTRVIGITSSLRGEGKSTTSVNLANSLAETGKFTLLIDADMRLANIHKLLNIQLKPGLSNILVGAKDNESLIRQSGIHPKFHVMTAGDIPPNPSELLSSDRMKHLVKNLSAKYDYIIIDLPPIDAVADALIVSEYVDGMIIVVRENYTDKRALDNAIRQLQFHKANILGFVLNCVEAQNKYYRKKYSYYNKYGYTKRSGTESDEADAQD